MANNGTVKFFNTSKGFGFITPDDGFEDVFIHISALEKSRISQLNDGQKVSCEIVPNRGRTDAANIQL